MVPSYGYEFICRSPNIQTPPVFRRPARFVMNIFVNGEAREVDNGVTLAALLAQLKMEPRNVAVEVNLEVVPRGQHAECVLGEGDRLEIVTLVGGG